MALHQKSQGPAHLDGPLLTHRVPAGLHACHDRASEDAGVGHRVGLGSRPAVAIPPVLLGLLGTLTVAWIDDQVEAGGPCIDRRRVVMNAGRRLQKHIARIPRFTVVVRAKPDADAHATPERPEAAMATVTVMSVQEMIARMVAV